jgi:hypothetical protein
MSQAKFLAGVAKVIADSIRRFASDRGDVPFHMQELTDHVMSEHRVAPDSPGRVLRMLRGDGSLDYTVLNRAQSLYQFT